MLFCLTVIIYLAMFGESAYTIQDSALGELNPIKNRASSRLRKGLGLWLPGSKYEEVEHLIEHCHGVCNPPGIEKKRCKPVMHDSDSDSDSGISQFFCWNRNRNQENQKVRNRNQGFRVGIGIGMELVSFFLESELEQESRCTWNHASLM